MTPENSCKLPWNAKDWNTFTWDQCEELANWGLQNDVHFRYHALIWARNKQGCNPDFILNSTDPDKLEDFMERYINEAVGIFGQLSYAMDVVNEAIDDSPSVFYRDNVWNQVDDFICKAFHHARDADPNVELFYNDYGHLSMTGKTKTKSDKVYKLISELVDRDCPIDGVGF